MNRPWMKQGYPVAHNDRPKELQGRLEFDGRWWFKYGRGEVVAGPYTPVEIASTFTPLHPDAIPVICRW